MKYKLIKKLPFESSPEIGYISEEKMVGSELHYWNANWFDPANYPEFWKLIVEKDWEILEISLKRSIKPEIRKVQGYSDDYIESLLKCDNHIHSIKRLSDGEIFSVGDKLDLRAGEIRKITGISLDDTGVSEFSKRSIPWLECGKDYGTCLDWAVHYKEPILITEDGAELFEGDYCCAVYTLPDIVRTPYTMHSTPNNNMFKITKAYRDHPEVLIKGCKYFSTKEAAEKYIEENKPRFSKKDMLSFGASMSSTLYPYQCKRHLEHWKKFKKENND